MMDIFQETQAIRSASLRDDRAPELQAAVDELLAATMASRWQRYDEFALALVPATDADLKRLRDVHRACNSNIEAGPGWYDLLNATFSLIEEKCPGAEWSSSQIKEKFGGLRLYWVGDLPSAGDLVVDAAEVLSEHICEECGAPGGLDSDGGFGWLQTLCDVHAEGRR